MPTPRDTTTGTYRTHRTTFLSGMAGSNRDTALRQAVGTCEPLTTRRQLLKRRRPPTPSRRQLLSTKKKQPALAQKALSGSLRDLLCFSATLFFERLKNSTHRPVVFSQGPHGMSSLRVRLRDCTTGWNGLDDPPVDSYATADFHIVRKSLIRRLPQRHS